MTALSSSNRNQPDEENKPSGQKVIGRLESASFDPEKAAQQLKDGSEALEASLEAIEDAKRVPGHVMRWKFGPLCNELGENLNELGENLD